MASLWHRSAHDLLQQTASRAPTPGGGSAAALCGAFGAALLSMALDISREKDPSDEELHEMERLHVQLAQQHERLQALADEDVRAFEGYVEATALPKDSDEERRERERALEEAARTATRIPLDIARTSVETLELAAHTVHLVHKEVVSDVGAGAALLWGAVQAALLTVDINLPHLPSEEAEAGRTEREDLETRGQALAEETLRLCRERIGRGE